MRARIVMEVKKSFYTTVTQAYEKGAVEDHLRRMVMRRKPGGIVVHGLKR
jgi:hypothetical protein